jgi:hypothetical protein
MDYKGCLCCMSSYPYSCCLVPLTVSPFRRMDPLGSALKCAEERRLQQTNESSLISSRLIRTSAQGKNTYFLTQEDFCSVLDISCFANVVPCRMLSKSPRSREIVQRVAEQSHNNVSDVRVGFSRKRQNSAWSVNPTSISRWVQYQSRKCL